MRLRWRSAPVRGTARLRATAAGPIAAAVDTAGLAAETVLEWESCCSESELRAAVLLASEKLTELSQLWDMLDQQSAGTEGTEPALGRSDLEAEALMGYP
jgi:hypothetical protein